MKGEEARLNRWVSFSIYIYTSGLYGGVLEWHREQT